MTFLFAVAAFFSSSQVIDFAPEFYENGSFRPFSVEYVAIIRSCERGSARVDQREPGWGIEILDGSLFSCDRGFPAAVFSRRENYNTFLASLNLPSCFEQETCRVFQGYTFRRPVCEVY